MAQIAQTFDDPSSSGRWLNYWLYLPDNHDADLARRWPLILFLHGIGQRGDDLAMVKAHGPPARLDAGKDLPAIVVSPQCPAEMDWTPLLPTLMALVDHICDRYLVDASRIYLTGLSMGGRGAWHLAVAYPDRFAALVPICGSIPDVPGFLDRVCALQSTPIWVFHGALDQVVPVENSYKLVDALERCGGDVRLTIYPDLEHDSWTTAYGDPELYRWLFEQGGE
jgi:predicted peptidase